ncbi:MAG TPA: NAD-dependent formate dehydrogenase, partial [Gammaproteobacteria bacterium]|nr:NAD-dependent formate dehydrogenase [Gammaproteobacteria bacterium]
TKIDYTPGQLLGCISGELGLRKYLTELGHKLIVTTEKEGPYFDKELLDAEIVISQPFWPAYLSAEKIQQAKNLKLIITAGVGSDHIDLNAAVNQGITVAEVTYSNSNSVAEHAVMMILALVRNYIPSYQWIKQGGWNIADCVKTAYDLEGMQVGIIGAGRIGLGTIKRLQGFDVNICYTDRHRLDKNVEQKFGLTFYDNIGALVPHCDVISISCPLHAETENKFDEALLSKMKKGSYLINTARAKICDSNAIVKALETGQLAGYAGDVWYPQPPNLNHPWRSMPNHGMTPHVSGSTLSAQNRYAAGVREILECWFAKKPIRNEYLIVENQELAGVGKHAYSIHASTKSLA